MSNLLRLLYLSTRVRLAVKLLPQKWADRELERFYEQMHGGDNA